MMGWKRVLGSCATTSMIELNRFGIHASGSGRNLPDEIRWECGYGDGRQVHLADLWRRWWVR